MRKFTLLNFALKLLNLPFFLLFYFVRTVKWLLIGTNEYRIFIRLEKGYPFQFRMHVSALFLSNQSYVD